MRFPLSGEGDDDEDRICRKALRNTVSAQLSPVLQPERTKGDLISVILAAIDKGAERDDRGQSERRRPRTRHLIPASHIACHPA